MYSNRVKGRLRVVAFTQAATGVVESEGVLLRLTRVRGQPWLAGILLSAAVGSELRPR